MIEQDPKLRSFKPSELQMIYAGDIIALSRICSKSELKVLLTKPSPSVPKGADHQ